MRLLLCTVRVHAKKLFEDLKKGQIFVSECKKTGRAKIRLKLVPTELKVIIKDPTGCIVDAR